MHHYLRERNDYRWARAPSFSATVERRAKCRDSGRIPSRRNARACSARRRKNSEHLRAGGAGEGGNCRDGTIFGTRREKRIAAVAGRIAGTAKAGVPDAWGTRGRSVVAESDCREIKLEGECGAVFGHSGIGIDRQLVVRESTFNRESSANGCNPPELTANLHKFCGLEVVARDFFPEVAATDF